MSAGSAPSLEQPESRPPTTAKPAARNRARVIFSFGATWFTWGVTYLAIHYAVETIPPLFAAGFRHLTAGTILTAWCLYKGLRPTRQQIKASLIIGAFFFLGGHGSLHWAETRIPSGLASLMVASEPIWVFLMICAVTRSWKMKPALLAGCLLGLAGVALLLRGTILTAGPKIFEGAAITLFGAVSWGAGVVYSRRSHLSGHPLLLSALSLLAGAGFLITVGTILGEWHGFSLANVSLRSWGGFAFLTIFGSLVTFTAYNWLLERYPPTVVTTHTFINPVVAVLVGWLWAGESLSVSTAISAAMVIGAVILVERGSPPMAVAAEEG